MFHRIEGFYSSYTQLGRALVLPRPSFRPGCQLKTTDSSEDLPTLVSFSKGQKTYKYIEIHTNTP